MSLDETRKRIDAIDAEIVRLLDLRAEAGREAGRQKKGLGLPMRNPEREREVIAGLAARSSGSMPRRGLESIYRTIIAETLSLEENDRPSACDGNAGGKRDVPARIVENAPAGAGFFRMRLRVPELAGVFRPGQFFQLLIGSGDGSPFLRRPFAPSEITPDGFGFVYAVVGEGTGLMSRLPAGSEVRVLAPLGNGYSLPPAGSSALLLGGGCGSPSLAPLSRALRDAGVATTVILGARSAQAMLGREEFEDAADRLVLATDDGSLGCRGTGIDAFHIEEKAIGHVDRLYACGPIPMLRGAAALARRLGADCEVSLEERMACGFGACMGCAVPVLSPDAADGYVFRRVCHEGPVFNAGVLAWDRMR